MIGILAANIERPDECVPENDRRVLCVTATKKGALNYYLGYWDGERWVCGMNSNVVAWVDIPDPEKLRKELPLL